MPYAAKVAELKRACAEADKHLSLKNAIGKLYDYQAAMRAVQDEAAQVKAKECKKKKTEPPPKQVFYKQSYVNQVMAALSGLTQMRKGIIEPSRPYLDEQLQHIADTLDATVHACVTKCYAMFVGDTYAGITSVGKSTEAMHAEMLTLIAKQDGKKWEENLCKVTNSRDAGELFIAYTILKSFMNPLNSLCTQVMEVVESNFATTESEKKETLLSWTQAREHAQDVTQGS
jgi:hypothetical protein